MKPAVSSRAVLWIGLAIVAAALLLDALALLSRVSGRALPETPGVQLAGRFAQALVFAGGIAVLRSRRPAAGPFPLGRLCGTAAALAGMQAAALLFAASTGILELLWAGAAVGLLLLTLHGAVALFLGALGARRTVPGVTGPLVAIAALTLSAALLEALLAGLARRPAPPAPTARARRLVMPDRLGRRDARVEGAHVAWWWQGQLHVFDKEGLRRTTPLPPKAPGTFRVAALGDSLTYGYGVAAGEAWPAQLEQALRGEFRLEVVNLGICGLQSEGMLDVLRRHLPGLEADLVLYGFCLNDFLPARRGQYLNNRAWRIDPPGGLHLEWGTRLGALVAQGYDRLLMRIGVRTDFFTDILRDFENYQERFARDAAAMNRLVTSRGLPPITALVLNQFPDPDGPGGRIGRLAEGYLRAAGMQVIPSDYLQAIRGRGDLLVSPWESHPSAAAHRVFAGEFLGAVRRDPRLDGFRRRD